MQKPSIRTDGSHGAGVVQTAAPIVPRLLSLEVASAYLGVSPWKLRELEAGGIISRVRIPLPGQGELRKLLFDKFELDRLIEIWKERGEY